MPSPPYEDILAQLKVPDSFFPSHRETIFARLLDAYNLALKNHDNSDYYSNDEILAINQCLHLASSVVLLGVSEQDLPKAFNHIKSIVSNQEPTKILTVATLYRLLLDQEQRKDLSKDDRQKMRKLIELFERYNWMIGIPAMTDLGIQPMR